MDKAKLSVVKPKSEEQGGLMFIQIDDLHLIPREQGQDAKPQDAPDLVRLVRQGVEQVEGVIEQGPGLINLLRLPVPIPHLRQQHRTLFINLLSLAKEVQGQGFVTKQLHPFMRKLCQQLGLRNYKGITSRPDGFCRQGFKRDHMVLVEG